MGIRESFLALVIVVLLGLVIGITVDSVDVSGWNNGTTWTRVNVTNQAPYIYNITITPSLSINLAVGNITEVNCTALIYDANGWDDIKVVNATLYDLAYGDGVTTDNNYRYRNTTCNSSCVMYGGSNTNASCSCMFAVQYYANNGTWQCNVTIADEFGLGNNNISNNFTINPVLGIDVPNELDYGNMSITEISLNKTLQLINLGNVPINISVREWGGTQSYSALYNETAMMCGTGNISHNYQRYGINSTVVFNNKLNLTNTSTGIAGFKLHQRQDDGAYGNSSNTTYWQLEIPPTVSGFCNGTLEFTAMFTEP